MSATTCPNGCGAMTRADGLQICAGCGYSRHVEPIGTRPKKPRPRAAKGTAKTRRPWWERLDD